MYKLLRPDNGTMQLEKLFNDNDDPNYPGVPFISIKIGKRNLLTLIGTGSQKSFISREMAIKCGLSIDSNQTQSEDMNEIPAANIYGKIYDQKIIINKCRVLFMTEQIGCFLKN